MKIYCLFTVHSTNTIKYSDNASSRRSQMGDSLRQQLSLSSSLWSAAPGEKVTRFHANSRAKRKDLFFRFGMALLAIQNSLPRRSHAFRVNQRRRGVLGAQSHSDFAERRRSFPERDSPSAANFSSASSTFGNDTVSVAASSGIRKQISNQLKSGKTKNEQKSAK